MDMTRTAGPVAAIKVCAWIFALAGVSCSGRFGDPESTVTRGTGPGAAMPGSGSAGPGSPSSGSSGSGSTGGATPGGTGSGTGTGTGTGGTACPTIAETQVPFRVLTRLNRLEYDNTARDLLGDTTHVVLNTLPADFGDGAFDNNAAALSIDPMLVEGFVQVAETLAENALATGSAGRGLVMACTTTDDACARQITSGFASRAWRRPLVDGELDRLFAIYTKARTGGATFDQGIQMVVEAALLSPNFLFRPEIDPILDSPTQHPVSAYELASRLSYFLWSSMPDAALTSAAADGQLQNADAIRQQAQRMWTDPKAEAIYSRFPGLWLATLDVTGAKEPAPEVFPAFDATLEAAMEGETAAYMREFMTQDVNFLDILDAKFTFANQRLAQFYGLPGRFTTAFTRVDLATNTQRGGILTQASFLTTTSAPERTSPVMRGQWVLARLLASPPPPPPDNVPPITAVPDTTPMTFRQKLEAHVSNAVCASCHNLMDPIGFGLENYDGIGAWRTMDNGQPVDANGKLTTGETFTGAIQLESILRNDPRVPTAVVQYLTSYAFGRQVGAADQCMVEALTSAFKTQDNSRMSALVLRVASLDAMGLRRGAP